MSVAATATIGLLRGSSAADSSLRSPRQRRFFTILVIADLTVTMTLVAFAAQAASSVGALLERPTGFDLDQVMTVGISIPGHRNTQPVSTGAAGGSPVYCARELDHGSRAALSGGTEERGRETK